MSYVYPLTDRCCHGRIRNCTGKQGINSPHFRCHLHFLFRLWGHLLRIDSVYFERLADVCTASDPHILGGINPWLIPSEGCPFNHLWPGVVTSIWHCKWKTIHLNHSGPLPCLKYIHFPDVGVDCVSWYKPPSSRRSLQSASSTRKRFGWLPIA